jgi:hypothetical protein
MGSYLSHTIAALCDAIAATHDIGATDPSMTLYDDVTAFVLEQLQKMPPFLRYPLLIATAVFGISRLWLEGSVFYKRPRERRQTQVENWRCSSFGPSRDLMKFYTSVTVLAVYSRRGIEAKDSTEQWLTTSGAR